MRINELITRLEAFERDHGNLEVYVETSRGGLSVSDVVLDDYEDGTSAAFIFSGWQSE